MSTIIIILAIVLILGSMLWVLPSPKERRQMQLRKFAMDNGLTVQITKINDFAHPGQQLNCVAYRLFEHDNKKDQPNWKLFRTDETWRMDLKGWTFDKSVAKESIENLEKITECINQLPEGCLALESNKQCTSVYWHERGDEQTVEKIVTILKKIHLL